MRPITASLKSSLSALALTIGLAAPVGAETLTDALVMAYTNSPDLDVARAGLRATDEGVPQARAGLRPSVNATANATLTTNNDRLLGSLNGVNDQQSVGLSSQWTVFDGGATEASVNAALANVNAQRGQLMTTEQQVLLDAVTAYLDVRRDIRFVNLAANNVRVISRQLQAAQDRFDVGEVTRTDVAQARARLAAARSNLVANQGALDRSREAYVAAIGTPPGDLAPPPPLPDLPESQAEAEAIAMETHPILATRQAQVRAAEFQVDRARASFRPNVTLQGSATISNEFDGRLTNERTSGRVSQVGANLQLPLYAGGQLSSAVRQAVSGLEQAQASLQASGRDIRQSVGLSWANLTVSRASITSSRQQITAARIAFEGIVEEARLGARTTLDVLDTEQELLNAQSNLVSAQRDETVAAYTLLSAMGLLTVEHLGLPVDQYDPTIYFEAVEDGPFARDRQEVLNRILGRY